MGGGGLQHVRQRTGREPALRQIGVVVYRDEHHSRARMTRQEGPRGRDPVTPGHHDVGDHDVRVHQVRGAEKAAAVRDHGDDVELGLEQLAQLFATAGWSSANSTRGRPMRQVSAREPVPRYSQYYGRGPENSGGALTGKRWMKAAAGAGSPPASPIGLWSTPAPRRATITGMLGLVPRGRPPQASSRHRARLSPLEGWRMRATARRAALKALFTAITALGMV
jgi:hypothetical protein